MQDFDTDVYNTSSSSYIYRIVDALCGSTGAGALLNQNFINTLQGDLNTTYGSDLDYFFGNIGFLPRSPAESYSANTSTDLLDSDQWDSIRIQDAWYRARIKNFWTACGMGGVADAIRLITQAACSCDANVYEVWRYLDSMGLTESLGRADSRNEVVVQPLKSSLSQPEFKLLRDMLARVMPVDTVVTINTEGLAVLDPVPIASACASSTYFEITKTVTATPVMSQLPTADQLPIDLLPTEQWLYAAQTDPQIAPYSQFNMCAQYEFYYLVGGGARSPIDSVTYGTIAAGDTSDTVVSAPNYQAFTTTSSSTAFTAWPLADSPDNYPGGQHGIHPSYPPALNPDGTPYQFPWISQGAYITAQIAIIESVGGTANTSGYQLPVAQANTTSIIFLPEYAISYNPPGRDSTISYNNFRNRPIQSSATEVNNPVTFVRS
jgi:hypothetical protein